MAPEDFVRGHAVLVVSDTGRTDLEQKLRLATQESLLVVLRSGQSIIVVDRSAITRN